jgi:uncharacterized protein YlxP (DUF503 family)
MAVTVLTWEFRLPGCRSLKEKRAVIRSLRDRLQQRFRVSVAETGHQDVHDRAQFTVALAAADGSAAASLADRVARFVETHEGLWILEHRREEW